MRISKSAPDLLKKAVSSVKRKTDALKTRLIVLASARQRLAIVRATMSRQIHEHVASDSQEKPAWVEHRSKALMVPKAMMRSKEPAGGHGVRAHRGLFEVAMFEEDYHGYPDWTNSLFEDQDDSCYRKEGDDHDDDDHDDLDILDVLDEEPSVIEIIRSKREAEGLEFNMDHDIDIDEACDMFIRRFRSRMNRSLSDLYISE